jgi:hypothetical protein
MMPTTTLSASTALFLGSAALLLAATACEPVDGPGEVEELEVSVEQARTGLAAATGAPAVATTGAPAAQVAERRAVASPTPSIEEPAPSEDWSGHVIIVGHTFMTPSAPLETALANAVLLKRKARTSVLVWTGSAPVASMKSIDGAITKAVRSRGGKWTKTVAASSASIQLQLPEADVLLVYPQVGATDESLAHLGDEWRLPLDDFSRRGGVIVVVEGGEANGGTAQVLEASGLITLGARQVIGGDTISVAIASEVAVGLPASFVAPEGAVGFAPSGWLDVLTTDEGIAAVVHRVIN